ncbi:MAG: hypothetical protein VXB01_03470 [Opitutae bacterium]|jgi:hypothetical protein
MVRSEVNKTEASQTRTEKNIQALTELSDEVLEFLSNYVGRKMTMDNMSMDEKKFAIMLSHKISYALLYQGENGFNAQAKSVYKVSEDITQDCVRVSKHEYRNNPLFRDICDLFVSNLSHKFAVEKHARSRHLKRRFMEKQLQMLQKRMAEIDLI